MKGKQLYVLNFRILQYFLHCWATKFSDTWRRGECNLNLKQKRHPGQNPLGRFVSTLQIECPDVCRTWKMVLIFLIRYIWFNYPSTHLFLSFCRPGIHKGSPGLVYPKWNIVWRVQSNYVTPSPICNFRTCVIAFRNMTGISGWSSFNLLSAIVFSSTSHLAPCKQNTLLMTSKSAKNIKLTMIQKIE